MIRWFISSLALIAAVGCQKGGSEAVAKTPYSTDVESICHAEARSGAEKVDPSARAIHVAQWLGRAIQTQEARQLLAELAKLPPAEKAARLSAEAAKVGVGDCPTARTWTGPGSE